MLRKLFDAMFGPRVNYDPLTPEEEADKLLFSKFINYKLTADEIVSLLERCHTCEDKMVGAIMARDLIMDIVMESKDVEFRSEIFKSDAFSTCGRRFERLMREH